ncbi:MAG: tetratricopeptide repeat protein [Planctomycetota bacterium]
MLSVNVESEFDTELLEEAIELLVRAVAGSPDNLRYHRVLGEAYMAQRKWQLALDQMLVVHDRERDKRSAYLIAHAYYRLDSRESAAKYLEIAGADDSLGFTKLHLLRGRILHDDGRFGDAVNEFGKSLIMKPDAPEPRWLMARSLVNHAQEIDDSVSLYRRALKLLTSIEPRKENEDEWNALIGRVYLALLYPVEALRHLENSRFGSEHEKLLLMGVAYLLKGNLRDSRKWLAMSVRDPRMRARCEAYLTEIACAPEGTLSAMDPAHSPGVAARFPDVDLLVGVFGPGSEEIDRILEAARSGRSEEMIRTQIEQAGAVETGRLFAAFDALDDDTRPDDPAVAARPALGPDEEATILSDAEGQTIAARRDPKAADRLFPQTWVDVGDILEHGPELAPRNTPADSGAKALAAGSISRTAPMALQDPPEPETKATDNSEAGFPELDNDDFLFDEDDSGENK